MDVDNNKQSQMDNSADYREYNIKNENKEYNLRIEIENKNIFFILYNLDESLEYNYKNKMDLLTITNKLELNPSKYQNLEIILKIFDNIYKKNKIIINFIDNNSCNLIVKLLNALEEEVISEIKLIKETMDNNEKIKYLFNAIKFTKNNSCKAGDSTEIDNIKNNLNKLNLNINKRDEEIKEELNKKDIIIQKLNEKIVNQENIINKMKDNINDIINQKFKELENNINSKINNMEYNLINNTNKKEDKIYDNIIKEYETNDGTNNFTLFKENRNEISNDINSLGNKENNMENKLIEQINIINNKIKEINNKNKQTDIIINEIQNKINDFKTQFNTEMKEYINNKNNERKLANYNNYISKINYKFKEEPQNLKYKFDITDTNTSCGWNDMFEIFICYKDNKEYLVSPNCNNFNLDIFLLLDNQKILSLNAHKNKIRTVRYFINDKTFNEYLISGDDNKSVIIWDITNNYNIKYQIETKYEHNIYSCLLVFPHSNNNNNNYIITSTYNQSNDNDKAATKIYSLENGKFIRYIKNTNNNIIYYLLSWHNKKNNKYYIIQFSYCKILITNLLEEKEFYSELVQQPEESHFSGFIFTRKNNDYLCSSSKNGYINIWDLYSQKIFKIINVNKSKLSHIIEWNNKYIIVANYENKSFKIIDLDKNKIVSEIQGLHLKDLYCIKKVYHPIYGESLLSSSGDKCIKLWSL